MGYSAYTKDQTTSVSGGWYGSRALRVTFSSGATKRVKVMGILERMAPLLSKRSIPMTGVMKVRPRCTAEMGAGGEGEAVEQVHHH